MGNREITEITISFKLHMTINEINTTLLLECHYQSLLSICNNFWLRSNVDFGQMMRQKYVISNILEEFYVEDTQFPFSRSLRVTSDDRRNWDLARETNPLRV